MTDFPSPEMSVPNRLGVTAQFESDELTLLLVPQPETLHHGVVRASVLSFVIDVVAGITVDRDPDVWTLTTDMTVRTRSTPAPRRIAAVSRVVRRGRRSVTCTVDLVDDRGEPFAAGAIGFASVPRKEGDPPKPMVEPADAVHLFHGLPGLTRPLREEAGIEVIDAASGVVQLDVTPELRNPVGTLQGAMVALLAEAAAEELLAARAETPVVITDLDLRYLAQAPTGPVRTSVRVLDDTPLPPVEVSLVDTSTGKLTTLVHARGAVPT